MAEKMTNEGPARLPMGIRPRLVEIFPEGPAPNPFRLSTFAQLLAKEVMTRETFKVVVTGDEKTGLQIHVPLDRLERMSPEDALVRLALHRERLLDSYREALSLLERINGTENQTEMFEHRQKRGEKIRSSVGLGIRFVPPEEKTGNLSWMRPLPRKTAQRRIRSP